MATFEDFWRLLYNHGSSPRYKDETIITWDGLTPEQQQRLYDNIKLKIEQGKFVDYNPKYAIHDNLPRRAAVRKQVLSYNEYYSIYRTTQPKDGWEMQKGADGKVYYSKSGQSNCPGKEERFKDLKI